MNLSIFQNMTSKLPQPGSLEGVANLIRSDEIILPRIPQMSTDYIYAGICMILQTCCLSTEKSVSICDICGRT